MSDVKLSVDDELLTMVYRFSGRFFGLLRIVTCAGWRVELLKCAVSFSNRSIELAFVGDGANGARIRIACAALEMIFESMLNIQQTYLPLIVFAHVYVHYSFC